MKDNAYNVISFQTDEYTDHFRIEVTPKPDLQLWSGEDVSNENFGIRRSRIYWFPYRL